MLSLQGDSAAGYATLHWEGGGEASGAEFLLEESGTEDFRASRVRYQGFQHGSVLSGLANGAYHFRVRSRASRQQPWGAWSAPRSFTVVHHGLPLALVLLGTGALVFGLTLGFLLVFSRRVSP